MSLNTVFASFNTSYSSSKSVYIERSEREAKPNSESDTNQRDSGAVSDTYIASESYRFKASYSVYQSKSAQDISTQDTSTAGGFDTQFDAANTILNFISARLSADKTEGADQEALSSRLSAGLEGFIEGFQQAYEQLSELSFLNEGIEDAIEQTYSAVVDGIDELAEKLEIESPVLEQNAESLQSERREAFAEKATEIEPPASSSASVSSSSVSESTISSEIKNLGAINERAENLKSLISASSYDYRASESRSFSFSLTTQDGDKVTIKAAYDNVSILQGQNVDYGESESSEISGSFRASSGFYLDVRGELDEDEYLAIEELLSQVKQVSDLFFSGDLEAAFNYATEMGFDESEIAEFSLRLRYQVSVVAEETYQQFSPEQAQLSNFDAKDPRIQLISQFIQTLEDLRIKAENIGITGFAASDLAEVALTEEEPSNRFGLVQRYLNALEALQDQV